jgi:hypothetical protein
VDQPLNRVAIILDEHGEFSGMVADSPIEFFVVQPSCRRDRVYKYESGEIGPQHVQAAFAGNPVGHLGDGMLDVGIEPTLKLRPSKPNLSLVAAIRKGEA